MVFFTFGRQLAVNLRKSPDNWPITGTGSYRECAPHHPVSAKNPCFQHYGPNSAFSAWSSGHSSSQILVSWARSPAVSGHFWLPFSRIQTPFSRGHLGCAAPHDSGVDFERLNSGSTQSVDHGGARWRARGKPNLLRFCFDKGWVRGMRRDGHIDLSELCISFSRECKLRDCVHPTRDHIIPSTGGPDLLRTTGLCTIWARDFWRTALNRATMNRALARQDLVLVFDLADIEVVFISSKRAAGERMPPRVPPSRASGFLVRMLRVL